MTFHVLVVCTGNICRSAMAQELLREGLGEAADVSSAGTIDLGGAPMEPFALSTLEGLGLDGSTHRSRELTRELVEQADLVLTATRQHRAAVVTLSPRAAAKTFTLREFDRLLGVVEPAPDPRAVVAAAAAARGTVRPERPADDDVIDPYRGPESGFVATAELLQEVLARPIALLSVPSQDRRTDEETAS